MKKYIIALTLFLAVTVTAQSQLFKFRDGTTLKAKIHTGDQWGPNSRGVVLKVDDAVYFHDYPSGPESLAPPIHESDANPFSLPSCAPSRISFRHFKPDTLRNLNADFGRMPTTTITDARRGINAALSTPTRFHQPARTSLTSTWRRMVEHEMGGHFRNGQAVWGKHIRAKTPSTRTVSTRQTTSSPLTLETPTNPSNAFNTTYPTTPATVQLTGYSRTQQNPLSSLNTNVLERAAQLDRIRPARQLAWITGQGTQNRLDLGYLGSRFTTIQQNFGQPDMVQGAWWGYRGMNITDFPTVRRHTVAWFGFQNGTVTAVRIGN
jgi:hypothetical protein